MWQMDGAGEPSSRPLFRGSRLQEAREGLSKGLKSPCWRVFGGVPIVCVWKPSSFTPRSLRGLGKGQPTVSWLRVLRGPLLRYVLASGLEQKHGRLSSAVLHRERGTQGYPPWAELIRPFGAANQRVGSVPSGHR